MASTPEAEAQRRGRGRGSRHGPARSVSGTRPGYGRARVPRLAASSRTPRSEALAAPGGRAARRSAARRPVPRGHGALGRRQPRDRAGRARGASPGRPGGRALGGARERGGRRARCPPGASVARRSGARSRRRSRAPAFWTALMRQSGDAAQDALGRMRSSLEGMDDSLERGPRRLIGLRSPHHRARRSRARDSWGSRSLSTRCSSTSPSSSPAPRWWR